MKSAPRIYDFNLTANGSQWFPVVGSYFRINGTTGPVTIKLDTGAEIGPLQSGQGMKNTPFGSIMVIDKSGAFNAGAIIVADDDFVDQQFSGTVTIAGGASVLQVQTNVQTVNGNLANARAGRKYLLVQNKDNMNTLYLAFGIAATIGNGIKVPPGASIEFNGAVPTANVYGLVDIANTSNVVIVEGY